jgi:probable HAF family extracellular repeat protein
MAFRYYDRTERYDMLMTTYRFKCRTCFFVALLIYSAFGDHAAATPPAYHVTDLGTLGGSGALGLAINAGGQVTGASGTSGDAESHAFVWTPTTPNSVSGTMHDIGTLGGTQSEGVAINASAQVTGVSLIAGESSYHAFLYDGTMHDLGAVGGRGSNGNGINNLGHVVGVASDGATNRAFLYDGTRHYLFGDEASFAAGINASGQVAGNRNSPSGAFLWSPTTPNGVFGTAVSLGHLGGFETNASAINASGHVTGKGALFPSGYHAFLYDGTMHDLGALDDNYSNGYAINDFGQVTGESNSHAFLFTSEMGMVDLNTLIDPLSGWTLGNGQGINNVGQITGFGFHGDDGQLHAFLLTPVPEPATFALLMHCLPLLIWWCVCRSPKHGGIVR